ncbi:MAG: hypothetical protein QME48_07010 [bacterium]|nr:hypothetical protein [bacterium]
MLKKIIIFILIISLNQLLLYPQTEESDSLKSLNNKPLCCLQFPFLSNNQNVAKDNLIFGCCVGSPVAGSIIVSAVGFVLLLLIGILEFVFSLGQSKSVINSIGNFGIPTFIVLLSFSTLLSLLSIVFTPYYDYSSKEIKKGYKNFIVLLERGTGCLGSTLLSLLTVYLIFKNSEGN